MTAHARPEMLHSSWPFFAVLSQLATYIRYEDITFQMTSLV